MRRITAAFTLALALVAGGTTAVSADDTPPDPLDQSEAQTPAAAATVAGVDAEQCMGPRFIETSADGATAAAIMAGRLTIGGFARFTLPKDPTWRENPFKNNYWLFQYESLRWLDPLRREGLRTDNAAMISRYEFLVNDWVRNNPRNAPRSPYSWLDMTVGVRAIGLVCATTAVGNPSWLTQAMSTHAAALMDKTQYRVIGNHALHQNMGLLALGCHTSTPAWTEVATDRNRTLLSRSVDTQGVTDEGSVTYQYLNYLWYLEVRKRLELCDIPATGPFERIALMPKFLAQATKPNTRLVSYGDTDSIAQAQPIPGTDAEYSATQGTSGVRPSALFSVYQRGFAFSRTGWFDTQTAAQQAQAAIRFGPSLAARVHGHEDAGAISYYAMGKELLWQPGQYGAAGGAPRRYVRSNEAHNVIDIPALTYDQTATSPLSVTRSTRDLDLVTIRSKVLTGASWQRSMIHIKSPNLLVVDDRVTQSTARTVIQRWNVGADRSAKAGNGRAGTSGSGSNATFLWAGDRPNVSIVKGRTNPMLGWRSEKASRFIATPVVQASLKAKTVRLTAVIVPRSSSTDPTKIKIIRTSTTSTTRMVDVKISSKVYRVTFTGSDAKIRRLR
ncbi:heparinase II/III family protein [Aeromicrobium sp.]|uniref:heparinase II/III domain-containing protein n=1 Tax=Aeromicrobium sp. TaxID=1871063 RepID=UPI0019B389B9|nr:heparinase II/III family protein [Aeromicrobium sp.]MBC7633045.1 heparinase II/III family protein [Aeromicrobium sp.]